MTGAAPAQFLAALRMVEAQRRLMYTSASVRDICMDVGYSSIGTFTSRFTYLVGVPPGQFRRASRLYSEHSCEQALASLRDVLPAPARRQVVCRIDGELRDTVAAVGLFSSGIPQGPIFSCGVVGVPGIASLGDLPDGEYHLRAISFDPSVTVAGSLSKETMDFCYVGASRTPVKIVGGVAVTGSPARMYLRSRRYIDPPLVLALPLVMESELERSCSPSSEFANYTKEWQWS
ncbi:helix-turn-helix domain-containing protein [Nocardia sp. NPDC060256]|uniref:helix-turn-helix domain-containing protein n=1 Tax=unclassified Nocardia TaxID=2637762 RepID=UPI003666296D